MWEYGTNSQRNRWLVVYDVTVVYCRPFSYAQMEAIGIALDLKEERMFLTDLVGSVYSAKLTGSDKKTLLYSQGNLTGIAYTELPSNLA
jgi:hypothetical protein